MNLVIGLLLSLLAMDCTHSFSVPQNEKKSWIRFRRESVSSKMNQCPGPECFTEEHKNCLLERNERTRLAQLTKSNEYIPSCRKDGSYASVQCHPGTKSCWCVTHSGRPIIGSTLLNKKPNCSKYLRNAKSVTKRRSSHTKKNRRICNHGDRATFNSALIKTFRSEFNRIRTLTQAYKDADPNNDEIVLGWKFEHLDINNDNYLHRNETNYLKRLIKQQIQPRTCANSFVAHCSKGDKKISKQEWLECLRVEAVESLPFDTFNSLVDSAASRGMNPFQLLRPASSGTGLAPPIHSRSSDVAAEVANCWTDRQSALTSQQLDSNKSIIIPECTPTGQYQKTQCAQGRAYCWCVNETTGLEIPDTVAINSLPNCDKPMKGCSGKIREKFLIDLMDTLTRTMTAGDPRRPQEHRNMTIEERASRFHFQRLDANHNGVLDRKEWKVFKSETATDSKLKRCGKKLPRSCDVNKDKKISVGEWLECLQVKPESHSSRRTSQRSSGGLRVGKNPFTTILQ